MSDGTYNGWKNYATWGVALVLDNDEGTYNEAHEVAERLVAEAPGSSRVADGIWTVAQAAQFNFADWAKDYVETLCGTGSESEDYGIAEPTMMAQQLLGAAIAEVDWDEIASHYISDALDN